MKISYIELCGFRGFRERARLEFTDGFVVLTGRNGAGKSTVLDAFDFALTGTINKYRVKGAKGGGLAEHIWWVGEGQPPAHYVKLGFTDRSGDEFVVTRSREHGLETPEHEIRQRLSHDHDMGEGWEDVLARTTLLRDETIAAMSLDLPEQARFNAVREAVTPVEGRAFETRTKAICDAALTEKQSAEERLKSMQSTLGQRLSALTEARGIAEAERDSSEAEAIIERIAPETLRDESIDRLESLRRQIVSSKNDASRLSELVDRASELSDALGVARSPEAKREIEAAREAVDVTTSRLEATQSALEAAKHVESLERTADDFAEHMVSLLEHGEALGLQDGRCPLCQAARTTSEFEEAIEEARRRLEDRGARARRARTAVKEAEKELRTVNEAHESAREQLAALEAREEQIVEEVRVLNEALATLGIETSAEDVDSLKGILRRRRDEIAELEYAFFVLETSTAHDRVAEIERAIHRLREEIAAQMAEVAAVERVVEITKQIDFAAREVPNQLLAEQFDTVLPLLRELYQRLRPHNEWREIEADFGGRVRASLNLTVGERNNPQFVFSSGQRRAAGIAFLLSVVLSRSWSPLRSVLLDDPIQHIDDYRAVNLVEVLSAVRRTGRQIVVSVEDAALADLLCRRLRSTVSEPGRRFDLKVDVTGSATVADWREIPPLPTRVLQDDTA